MLRQLRQLQVPQVRGQRETAALQDHGQVQPQENQHRLHKQRLLPKYPEGALFRVFHAGWCFEILQQLTRPHPLCSGCAFREDRPLPHCEGQPSGAAPPQHVSGPQARVGPLQRVRPHHQELHQDLHRCQARVAHQVSVIILILTGV